MTRVTRKNVWQFLSDTCNVARTNMFDRQRICWQKLPKTFKAALTALQSTKWLFCCQCSPWLDLQRPAQALSYTLQDFQVDVLGNLFQRSQIENHENKTFTSHTNKLHIRGCWVIQNPTSSRQSGEKYMTWNSWRQLRSFFSILLRSHQGFDLMQCVAAKRCPTSEAARYFCTTLEAFIEGWFATTRM